MISLKGRHPVEPGALKLDSANDVAAVLAKSQGMVLRKFKEADFQNHWGEYKHLFIRPQYNGKCAYCESSVVSGASGDVEHFRPKSYCQALSPAKNRDDYNGRAPGRRNLGGATEGYWWLAYEWSNYLLSCARCNSTWKRNQFPISGIKAGYGGVLSLEAGLLINPFEMDPEPHFEFNVTTGQIRGVTAQGEATVDVCGLDRRSLDVHRSIKGAKLLRRYAEFLKGLSDGNVSAQNGALRSLLDECRSKEPFAAMARYFVKSELDISYSELLLMKRSSGI